QLECGGGDPTVANNIALFIRDELKDQSGRNPVMTVAYVTEHARDLALFVALGCTQIVMHKDAKLGDFDTFLKSNSTYEASMSTMLKDLAEKRYYPPLAVQGMVDRNLHLYWAKNQKNPLQWGVIKQEELTDKWVAELPALKPPGE